MPFDIAYCKCGRAVVGCMYHDPALNTPPASLRPKWKVRWTALRNINHTEPPRPKGTIGHFGGREFDSAEEAAAFADCWRMQNQDYMYEVIVA